MKKIIIFGLLVAFSACKTYEIPVDSFKEQFKNVRKQEKIINMNGTGMLFSYSQIPTVVNNLDSIKVIDKKGEIFYLINSPSIEIRFFDTNKKHYTMYFDSVFLENDTLTGSRSRFISNLNYRIPFASIQKINIQDGKKNFKYQQKR